MDGASYTGVANGNIKACRFLVYDQTGTRPTAANLVIQATGNTVAIAGISQKGSRYVPWNALDDGLVAIAGEMLAYGGPGDDEALLAISANCNSGQELISDSNGLGTPTTAADDYIGAIAKESGLAGETIRVRPVRYQRAT